MTKKLKNLKISYEKEADILRVEISRAPIDYATELGNVVVHFTPDNQPVYLEFLEASQFVKNISDVVKTRSRTYA